jgi:hypothetical protein
VTADAPLAVTSRGQPTPARTGDGAGADLEAQRVARRHRALEDGHHRAAADLRRPAAARVQDLAVRAEREAARAFIMTRTAHSEALIVSGAGHGVDGAPAGVRRALLAPGGDGRGVVRVLRRGGRRVLGADGVGAADADEEAVERDVAAQHGGVVRPLLAVARAGWPWLVTG